MEGRNIGNRSGEREREREREKSGPEFQMHSDSDGGMQGFGLGMCELLVHTMHGPRRIEREREHQSTHTSLEAYFS